MTADPAVRTRLRALSDSQPETRPWLTLLSQALESIGASSWRIDVLAAGPSADPAAASGERRPSARLDGATVTVDARAAERLLRALLEPLRPAGRVELDGLTLIAAAIAEDAGRVDGIARSLGLEASQLAPIAQLAAMPVLHGCRRVLEQKASDGPAVAAAPRWCCPVCGTWPTLAEVRGLDRELRLRCGRCGGDWPGTPLTCAFCGEADHRRLGALRSDTLGEAKKVSVCDTCKGYCKTISTLSAWPAETVALEDLATIDLDVVAIDRGYARPSATARPARVTLVAAGGRGLLGALW